MYFKFFLLITLLSGAPVFSPVEHYKNNHVLPVKVYLNSLDAFENVFNHGHAEFKNGELRLSSTRNWFLTTRQQFQNFVLEAEVKMPDVNEYSNSGIIFRGQLQVAEGETRVIGYQAEIDPSPRKWSGGLFDQGRRLWLHPVHPTRSHKDDDFIANLLGEWTKSQANAYQQGQWNHIKIIAKDTEISIFVNGLQTTHVHDQKDAIGVIGFQHHGSKKLRESGHTDNIVRFRNMHIRKIR